MYNKYPPSTLLVGLKIVIKMVSCFSLFSIINICSFFFWLIQNVTSCHRNVAICKISFTLVRHDKAQTISLLQYQKQQNRDTDSDVHLNINFGNKGKFEICLPTFVLCYFCWVQNNSVCDACIYCGQIRNK